MKTIVFVSQKTELAQRNPLHIQDICQVSKVRNAGLNLTGALVATQDRFAQVLEGPSESLGAVMTSILRDPRHTDVRLVREEPAGQRNFPSWSLAYVGRSTYVQSLVAPLLADRQSELETDKLIRLMREFAREGS